MPGVDFIQVPFYGAMSLEDYEELCAQHGMTPFVPSKPTPQDKLINKAIEVGKGTLTKRDFMQHLQVSDMGMIEAAVREAAKFIISEIGMKDADD